MNRENFNILVVDDEKDYCDVLKMILTGKGYKVDTCGNGQEAVDIFSSLEPQSLDAILMDMQMPVMEWLRGGKTHQNVRTGRCTEHSYNCRHS